MKLFLGTLVLSLVSIESFQPAFRSSAAKSFTTVASTAQSSPLRQQTSFIRTSSQRQEVSLSASSNSASSSGSTVDFDDTCDILVLGSGPAARAIASLLAAIDLDVLVSDQNFDSEWAPNYGVWKDEWQAVVDRYSQAGVELKGGKVGQAIDREWAVTDCYFGGSFDIPMEERMRLDRPYCRVDKNALRETLTPGTSANPKYRILKANHVSEAINVNLYSPAGSLVHDKEGTTIQLKTDKDEIKTIRSKLVVDCTGHETKLVLRESRDKSLSPGFQIAHGVLVDVDESNSPNLDQIGPYDKQAMTLFDYRTDHFDAKDSNLQHKVSSAPTFMYAMPLQGNQIFFEETSLVARPAVSFQECKERCIQRLKHHGIQVTAVHEEEFCYIPMGGALPARDQRILALGGAAAMVHPSTGYHICRCMMGAADVAQVIRRELVENKSPNLDRAAASAYHALWSPENIRQRNFAVFGGEFLMKQNVVGLRGFFDGFFRLPLEQWGGFLAGWPGLPNNINHETWLGRFWFGFSHLIRLPFPVALEMARNIIGYSLTEASLLQSVTPLLGEPLSYEYEPNQDRVGDVAAKQEARRMIQASQVTDELPVAFDAQAGGTRQEQVVTETDVTMEFAQPDKKTLPEPVIRNELEQSSKSIKVEEPAEPIKQ